MGPKVPSVFCGPQGAKVRLESAPTGCHVAQGPKGPTLACCFKGPGGAGPSVLSLCVVIKNYLCCMPVSFAVSLSTAPDVQEHIEMVSVANMDISYWSRGRYKLADSQHRTQIQYSGALCIISEFNQSNSS